MALSPALTVARISHYILRSRQVEFVLLFSTAALAALILTAQLAVVLQAGRWVEVGWVDLMATGGLLGPVTRNSPFVSIPVRDLEVLRRFCFSSRTSLL